MGMGEWESATAGMASVGQPGWGHCCQGSEVICLRVYYSSGRATGPTEHVESTGPLRPVLLRSMMKPGEVVNYECVGEGWKNFYRWETWKVN